MFLVGDQQGFSARFRQRNKPQAAIADIRRMQGDRTGTTADDQQLHAIAGRPMRVDPMQIAVQFTQRQLAFVELGIGSFPIADRERNGFQRGSGQGRGI